jgi:hypothetical protein
LVERPLAFPSLVNDICFHLWEQINQVTDVGSVREVGRVGRDIRATDVSWGESLDSGFEVVGSQTELLHVVAALHTPSSFASGLNRWQQQANQNSNDCNNNQKFHQCETIAVSQHTLSHRKTLYKKTKNKNNIMRTLTNLEGCPSAYSRNFNPL